MVAMLALVGGMGVAASFLAANVSRAQAAGEQGDDAEARAIIDKAIKAHGGADKLSQFKAVSAKWVGKRKVENVDFWDAVYVVTYEMPDRIRLDAEVENANGGKFAFSRVVNGKKGWLGWARGTRDLKVAVRPGSGWIWILHRAGNVDRSSSWMMPSASGFAFSRISPSSFGLSSRIWSRDGTSSMRKLARTVASSWTVPRRSMS
jgi:hypothetical protein